MLEKGYKKGIILTDNLEVVKVLNENEMEDNLELIKALNENEIEDLGITILIIVQRLIHSEGLWRIHHVARGENSNKVKID